MKNLILILKKISSVLLFLFLEIVAILLMVYFNNYQHSVFSSSIASITGSISSITGSIHEYFYLAENNDDLLKENARLREELLTYASDTANSPKDSSIYSYRIIPARVINNSVNNIRNNIILNKGEIDGIKPDMGVVCASGVVGIIKTTSDHFSVVIPIINNQSKISCKLSSTNNFGSLVWDGSDYRYAELKEIPKHVNINIGEKVCTSGFSAIFPKNIPIGEVTDINEESEQFHSIKVKLSTNFQTLTYVEVLDFVHREELDSISLVK